MGSVEWSPSNVRVVARTDIPDELCILTVHAHPDDEASKGAPTLAAYGELGVRTVLVCCTGGEEGDIQNPSLREPGAPFHGLSADEERALLARMRPEELARSASIIGFSDVVMLGYRDSGMADSPATFALTLPWTDGGSIPEIGRAHV